MTMRRILLLEMFSEVIEVQPAWHDKSEIVVSPPPECVQLCHDCVQTEEVVAAILLRLN